MEKELNKEAKLAQVAVQFLKERGFEVYQEVKVGGRRADLVGKLDNKYWIVEAKMSFGSKVVEQAFNWRYSAHWVSVAVPRAHNELLRQVCKDYGIGIIQISDQYTREDIVPIMMRNRNLARTDLLLWNDGIKRLKKSLREEQKDFALAGNNAAKCWTPWQSTCREILRYVSDNPGICVKKVVEYGGNYHYRSSSTARACIAKWALEDSIPGIRAEREGKFVRLYFKDEGSREGQ